MPIHFSKTGTILTGAALAFLLVTANGKQARAQISGFSSAYATNTTGSGGTPDSVASNVLTLTTAGSASVANSLFFTAAQNITSFTASFVYQVTAHSVTSNDADGAAFVIQNAGATAIGGTGGNFGVSGGTMSKDVAVIFSLDPSGTTGLLQVSVNGGAAGLGGVSGASVSTNPVNLDTKNGTNGNIASDSILANLSFTSSSPNSIVVQLTDQQTSSTVTQTLNIGSSLLTDVTSSTALIGFTGAIGGRTATQQISNFTFTSGSAPEPGSLALLLAGAFAPIGIVAARKGLLARR